MKINKNKRWCLLFIGEYVSLLVLIVLCTIIIDPYFHYHKPLGSLQYPIYNQRYQNDGIVKHFDYDAIITGTSMTENFRTTDMDSLFCVHSIKIPFAGGTFNEINQVLKIAIANNSNIKYIIRGLDHDYILQDSNFINYIDYTFPLYLYDNNLLNDINYIFNKEIFIKATLRAINYNLAHNVTTTFDDYSSWRDNYEFKLDKSQITANKVHSSTYLSDREKEKLEQNIRKNVLQLALDNPDIEFYFFYPPYSIYYFTQIEDSIAKVFEIEKLTTEILLSADNIHLFSFWDKLDIVGNLDNYKDIRHYKEYVNHDMLILMFLDINRLTKDNYLSYYQNITKIYSDYDYDSLSNQLSKYM